LCQTALYRHPAVLLAGGALAASLRAHGAEPTLRDLLSEDLNAYDAFSTADLLKAEGQVLQLLVDSYCGQLLANPNDVVTPGRPASPVQTLALWTREVVSRADAEELLAGLEHVED